MLPVRKPRECETCANNGNVIVDTNFIMFLMDYIYAKTSQHLNDYKFIDIYSERLEEFLTWLAQCSSNQKINVSEILYNKEIDFFRDRRVGPKNRQEPVSTLVRETKIFQKYPRNVLDLKYKFKTLFENYFSVVPNSNDLNIITMRADHHFGSYPPSEEDVSLIALGLRLADETNNRSILITEDMKLRNFIKNVVFRKDKFEIRDNEFLSSNPEVLSYPGFLDFLSWIFRDCYFDYLKDLMDYYENAVEKHMINIQHPKSRQMRHRLSCDTAFTVAQHIIYKKLYGCES